MPSITLRPDCMLIADACGTPNHSSSQVPSAPRPTHKWSFHTRLSATETHKIPLKKPFPCAHWETSPTKLNIALNGVETYSASSSMTHQMMPPHTLTSHKFSLVNSSKTLLLLVSDQLWRKLRRLLTWRRAQTSNNVLKLPEDTSRNYSTTQLLIYCTSSQKITRIRMDNHSGQDQREHHHQFHTTQVTHFTLVS